MSIRFALKQAFISTTVCSLFIPVTANATSLIEIYRAAVDSDPVIKSAEASLQANKELVIQGKSALLPSISASANLSHINSDSSDYTNRGLTLSLSQPIFDASAWFQFKRISTLSESATLQFEAQQQALIVRVIDAYLAVNQAQNNLSSAKAQELAIKRRLEKVQAEFEGGVSAFTNVKEAQASFDNVRVLRIEAEGDLDNRLEELSRIVGTPINNVDSLREDYPILLPSPATVQPWIDKALTENIDVKIAALNVEAARLNNKATRANRLPTLSLGLSHDIDQGSASNDDRSNTSSIALTLSVPLYQGGSLSSQSRESAYNYTGAQFDFDDARREVKLSVSTLLRNLKTATQGIEARKQSINSSHIALEATEEGFLAGTRTVVDVLSAEQALYTAQRDYENARLSYLNNLIEFKRQIGVLTPGDVMELSNWLTSSPSDTAN